MAQRVGHPQASAAFLTEILGRRDAVSFGPFHGVALDNGVTLDSFPADGELTVEHDAFLVSDAEFGQILGRIRARGLPYWADPGQQLPGRIHHLDGGRGVLWNDLDGHSLEIIIRPHGPAA